MMTRRGMTIASMAVMLAMIVAAALVGGALPEGARLPIHWNMAGEADGFASKWVALALPVAMIAFMSLVFYLLPAIEPRRAGLERSTGLYLWAWAGMLAIGVAVQGVVVGEALGLAPPVGRIMVGAIGLLLVLIGNQLGKSGSTYTVGIRTPWTLASEEVWTKTHRLGGKLTVAGGVALVAVALLGAAPERLFGVMIAVILVVVLVPVAYSFVAWRREQAQSSANRSTGE